MSGRATRETARIGEGAFIEGPTAAVVPMSPSGAMTSSAARSFAKGAPPRETLPPHLCGSDHRTRVLIDQLMEDAQCGLVVVDALEADNPIIYGARPTAPHSSLLKQASIIGAFGERIRLNSFMRPLK